MVLNVNIPSIPSMPFLGAPNTQLGPSGQHRPPNSPRPPPNKPIINVNGPSKPDSGQKAGEGFGLSNLDLEGSDSHDSSHSVTCILFTGIGIVVGIFVGIACLVQSVHRVQEGDIAIYFRNGALMQEIGVPGVHFCAPFVTTILQVTVRPETRYLNALKCTTSDGVVNVFREIQVISALDQERIHQLITNFGNDIKQVLVYERIGEGIQNFCANHSIDEVYNTKFGEIEESVKRFLNASITRMANDSITVWNLFIPKPEIPPAIAANYREVKIEWTRQLVAQQKMKTERIKKETVLQNEVLDAERARQISEITMHKLLEKKIGEKNVSDIGNSMRKQQEKTNTDIQKYEAMSKAESNQQLLTDQYIKLKLATSLANNTKVFFSGQDSALGSVFSNLLKMGGT